MPSSPWSAVPARRSSQARLNIKLWALGAVAGLAIVSGPVGLLINASRPAVSASKTTTTSPLVNSEAAVASVIAHNYMAGLPSPVPVAAGVSRDFGAATATGRKARAVVVQFSGAYNESNQATGQTWQLNSFVVQAGGRWYRLFIATEQVNGAVVLASTPSLLPMPTSAPGPVTAIGDNNTALPFSQVVNGVATSALPTTVTQVVSQWASAYASGNQARLWQLSGEPQSAAASQRSSYMGLGGFVVATTPRILSATWVDAQESYLLVRVRVVLTSSAAKSYTVANDYDLYVTGASTPNPGVIAWGPSGYGPLSSLGDNTTP